MNFSVFFVGLIVLTIVIFRVIWPRMRGPEAIVRGLLRDFHRFARTGLPEAECLLRVLSNRQGWKKFPPRFLAEIIARLQSKEAVFRFVSLVEGYRFHRTRLPAIAAKGDVDAAMREICLWLVEFGKKLHGESSFKQAEFVQRLALAFEPERVFTELPLALTCDKMARHEEAAALFKGGLSRLEHCAAVDLELLEGGASRDQLRARYREAYESCLKAGESAQSATA